MDARATVFGDTLLGPLTAALHALTPQALVSTAPFYQADVFTPLAWTALWRTILDASVATSGTAGALDVLAPQDGLGLGGGTAVAADLAGWFGATADAIATSEAAGRTALWDDVETYRLDGDPVSHPATSGDLVQAMTAAASGAAIGRFVAFTYAGNQLDHPAVDAAYRAYALGRADTVAPTKPGPLLVAARPERTSVTLSWTAASNNGSGVAGYLLFRDGQYARRLDDPRATSVTDTELAPGSHRWQLTAFDGAGNESDRRTSATVGVAAPAGTDLAAGARYWFPAALPSTSYSDGCRATTAGAACAGQLTGVRARTDRPPRTYPQTYQGYTGTIGDTTVVVDLGRARTLTDVTSHWLSYRSSSVRGPSTVTIAVSSDGVSWTTAAIGVPPARPVNSGFWPYYVSADRQAFATTYASAVATTARYVRVTATNPLGTAGWTMTDGVAVYGR